MRQITVLALIVGLAAFSSLAQDAHDLPPSVDQVISLLKLDPSVKQRVMAGEIVTYDREDSTDKELSVALVAVIKRPYDEVMAAVKGNRLFQFNQHILDFAEIKGTPDVSKFQGVGYTAAEADEVHAILAAEPGAEFNLSEQEIDSFQKLRAKAAGLDDTALIETVNETLRKFLAERLRRYQETGLTGIASYQRSGEETSSPAAELDAATRAMQDLKRFAPNFYSILQSFPNAGIEKVEHRFYVFKVNVVGRPGFILSHRIYLFGKDFSLLTERHIYAPHFYNSLQLVAGLIPYENSSVLFYGNRTYSDQVTGFGSRIKHSFGGAALEEGVSALIADIRAGIESGKSK
ncbi:MAG: hypothetical protein PVG38_03335 [Gammaproteobacteria bacterium]|jgi:hypothetical protein